MSSHTMPHSGRTLSPRRSWLYSQGSCTPPLSCYTIISQCPRYRVRGAWAVLGDFSSVPSVFCQYFLLREAQSPHVCQPHRAPTMASRDPQHFHQGVAPPKPSSVSPQQPPLPVWLPSAEALQPETAGCPLVPLAPTVSHQSPVSALQMSFFFF